MNVRPWDCAVCEGERLIEAKAFCHNGAKNLQGSFSTEECIESCVSEGAKFVASANQVSNRDDKRCTCFMEDTCDKYPQNSFDLYKACIPTNTEPPTPSNPTSNGDPHFTTWAGEHFDFHGECDLVLIHNPTFANGLGLEVHVRTKVETWYSYIETAAIRIGDETLEVKGGQHNCTFWFNGKPMGELQDGHGSLGDFPLHSKRLNPHHGKIRIELGNHNSLTVESYRDFVRVNVGAKDPVQFEGSIGMLGMHPGGQRMARNKTTIIKDVNEFGQEWQVLSTEAKLFHRDGAVRPPMKCLMPNDGQISKHMRRRLGAGAITKEEAAKTCAQVEEAERQECIFDVLATQDKDMALSHTMMAK